MWLRVTQGPFVQTHFKLCQEFLIREFSILFFMLPWQPQTSMELKSKTSLEEDHPYITPVEVGEVAPTSLEDVIFCCVCV